MTRNGTFRLFTKPSSLILQVIERRSILLKISSYEDIICAQGEVSLLGNPLSFFLFLVDGLLVDTGPSSLSKESGKFFKNHEINQVVLTHVHEDHCGMAAWLQENKQVPIFLHGDSIDAASRKATLPLYRLKIWGERPPFHAQGMPEEIRTPKHGFLPLDTPGHCANHTVFYEKEKGWLFTGDVFVSIKQHVAFREENLAQMIESLKKLLELDFNTIFCAHFGVLTEGYGLLEEKLAFLVELQEKVRDLETQGMSPRMIDRKLFPIRHPITDVSEGEGTSYNMVKTLGQV
jgi:glyoxylase-like metal-dependent hydrolase (beta-lactamase superfamily II)